ncbi:MAG: ATP-binding cassette domain-containing protein, partial [Natronomonas sp.]
MATQETTEELISTEVSADRSTRAEQPDETIVAARNLDVYYGREQAIDSVDIEIPENKVTALIGPSGCGKSTFLRCINRMNDQIDVCRVDGAVVFKGKNVYDDDVDPVALRRKIGQVFQKPNPFPKSIRENVVYGLEVQGQSATDEDVERALRGAAL